ncbi:multisubunit sodium/proton antiporter, MrpG subunit [Dethiosulfatibacter aminovorans DSM 17477]|uniref:Multisubunit sodium/proton antiporter, MrpG subunit n=1 Tax=Dethiosulfatibacter aminovorans DSM 17477 TaxID=1121476 RepID=A0A1M6GSQ0_9FIRM|nr:monovalent cation/H(+) antiporter subunit G [Dethiosulfatibacter aminovorans]SHJ12971.1 multisubunit sodium/proton antiporter, MrpG subunit [Dethiosulfatibacter aminovorans DSM 17477]
MKMTIGTILIWTGIIFIALGVLSIYRFKNFYPRILVASKIDTVGNITLMLGVVIKNGFTFFSLKVILILAIMTVINPLSTHSIARSAYFSGYRIRKE